ncbi:MAG: hypothetical protein H0U60_17525 [Blastocatellia bacterium]|nr:hypothetical protein [Blastocatellia bacterium]
MESEITTAETGLELPLAEPHFDDEATVLSARRVVPLDEVESYEAQTQSRFPRWWVFAATIAGAMLLGVVVGAAYYSYASRESEHALLDTESIAAGVDGMSTESPGTSGAFSAAPAVNHTSAADPNTDLSTRQTPAAAPQPEVSANESRKPTARRVDVLTFPSTPEEMQAREERKIRREARKRIRELERESRDPKSRNDLTRIREIFEGPQRP